MKKFRLLTSKLCNTIYAGHVKESRGMGVWCDDRQDVTIEALVAVAEHTVAFGKPVTISDGEGKLLYTITVVEEKS